MKKGFTQLESPVPRGGDEYNPMSFPERASGSVKKFLSNGTNPAPRRKRFFLTGFTIAEFLVAIMIIGILASASFWGYGERRQELKLQKEANFLVSKSEEIKEMAISGKHHFGIFPAGGYGVYFDSSNRTRYVLFADCNNNGIYDSSGLPCSGSRPETLEIITIDPAISLIVSSPINIVFMPPSPSVIINGNPQTVSSARLEITGTTKQKTIYFNSAGLIYVQ